MIMTDVLFLFIKLNCLYCYNRSLLHTPWFLQCGCLFIIPSKILFHFIRIYLPLSSYFKKIISEKNLLLSLPNNYLFMKSNPGFYNISQTSGHIHDYKLYRYCIRVKHCTYGHSIATLLNLCSVTTVSHNYSLQYIQVAVPSTIHHPANYKI
jgi:hypothetical protein